MYICMYIYICIYVCIYMFVCLFRGGLATANIHCAKRHRFTVLKKGQTKNMERFMFAHPSKCLYLRVTGASSSLRPAAKKKGKSAQQQADGNRPRLSKSGSIPVWQIPQEKQEHSGFCNS